MVPLATAEQLEGLAACMQTRCALHCTARCLLLALTQLAVLHSARKLTTVYQDNRREFVAKLGLELYQSVGGAAAAGAGTDSDAEEEEEAPFQRAAPLQQLALTVQEQQLALVPAPAPVQQLAAAVRGTRAPMAHLLSLVPAKRLRIGALLLTYSTACCTDCSPLSESPAASPAGKQGRPARHAPVAGHLHLTRAEVEELYEAGGSKALKTAFSWLFGCETASGNLPWLRNVLQGI